MKSYRGGRESVEVREELSEGVKRVSRQEGVTKFMLMESAYKVLVSKLSGEEDVVVGMVTGGQAARGMGRLVGYCVQVLPVRSRVEGCKSYREFLTEEKSEVLAAMEHQGYGLARLIRKLNPKREYNRTPLVSVTFFAGVFTSSSQLHIGARQQSSWAYW